MGVVNGTHQPIIIWHCRLKARIVAPQATDEMAEFSSVTKEEQSSYTTDVRSADLKATLKRKKYNRRTRLWRMKQDGGMRVVEFVFTYATVAQVVRASASYSEGQWFKSTLWHHKQKFDF